jgi:alpha-ketoglutaric semialdehyde dehydrogenase
MATAGTKTFQNYIGGEWVDAASGETFESTNPATGEAIGAFPKSGAEDVDRAVEAAKAAYERWRLVPAPKRAEILFRVGQRFIDTKDELTELMVEEMGKVRAEAGGDVQEAIDMTYYMAGEGRRLFGQTTPSEMPEKFQMSIRQPIGVVGAITPWNFPIAIPAWKAAPALAFGNTVVMKPATPTPAIAHALAAIIHEAGAPAGVFNLVIGEGGIGSAIVDHPGVDGISFTGSQGVGALVAQGAIKRQARVQLEMGGKNPLVVLDDADLSTAVSVAVNGAFFQAGQRCTASSRVIVTEGIHDRFVDAMIARMKTLVIDDALKPGTEIGPVVDQRQLDKNLEYLAIGRKEGARLAHGGDLLKRDTEGYYMAPALFAESAPEMRINQEEIFGPVASVIRVKDYDEALATANATPFGLSAGIVTTSLKHASHFKRNSESGLVMVNLPTAGLDYHVPFGGRKKSSYGPREQGSYAKEFYTIVKTAYIAP